MKKLIFSILMIYMPLIAYAEAVEIDGIWYKIINAEEVEVTINPSDYFGNIIIPSSVIYEDKEYTVTSIGDYAFYYDIEPYDALKSVTIPNSVTSIGYSAFACCKGLTSLTIPNSVTNIGDYAISKCSNLTSITISNSLTSIGDGVFTGCSSLTSITIPNSVKSIGDEAFYLCTNLTSIDVPNNVTSIGIGAFSGCTNLTNVEIPNSVTSIGSGVFYGCEVLTDICIPNSVTSIEKYSFSGCHALTTLYIGNGVTTIGTEAFADCPMLSNVYCLTEQVPNTSKDAFSKSSIEYATLHIPVDALDDYISEEPWSNFMNIIPIDSEEKRTLTYLIGEDVYKSESICIGQRIIPEPAPEIDGYFFLGWSAIPDFMPAHDVVVTGTILNSNISDGIIYNNNIRLDNVDFSYTRTFNNTNWQTLYVPFEMSYNDWKDDFDVAKINNFHEYDDNEDGVVDRTTLEIIYVKSGSTRPNVPYMIRAKETGTKTINISNSTLYPSEENSIDCSSVKTKYIFTGTFSGVSGEDMYNNGYYAFAGGSLCRPASSSVPLGPFRWYLRLENREGNYAAARQISVWVFGEDEEMSGIINTKENETNPQYYSLKGEHTITSQKSGVFIVRYADGKTKKIIK